MKRNFYIIIGAVILAVLAAGGILLYQFWGVASPEAVLQQYMSCIQQQAYADMYQLLDTDSQSRISQEDFISRNQRIYEGIGADNLQIDVWDQQSERQSVKYTTTMDTAYGTLAFDNTATFQKESRAWKIKWTDSLIFPDLTSEDKVQVLSSAAQRGNILDRNGAYLAYQGEVSSVGLVPGKLDTSSETDLQQFADLLGVSLESVEAKLQAEWVTEESFVPIKKMQKLQDDDPLEVQLLAIPGVMISSETDRVYPLGQAAAHLTGYVQGISAEELEQMQGEGYSAQSVIGKSGLERLYEKELHGEDGGKIIIADQNGETKRVLIERSKKDGTDVQVTIDAALQQAVYQQYQNDKSCSVVMNPKTGEVLALVSTPAFDSNDFVLGMSDAQWEALNQDEAMPLFNRFSETWCPGSSFKPVTAAVGLTSGKLQPDEDFGASGLSWQKDASWGDYHVTTLRTYAGPANLANALIYSDNIYFAKAALRIGADTLAEQLTRLGFGSALPFEMAFTASQYGNDGTISSELQLANSGYGQGELLVNPLHLAAIYSAFVNTGDMIQPYLAYQEAPKSEVWISQAFAPAAADTIREDLVQVISQPDGTGHSAYRSGLRLAGKTGTAEIKDTQDDTTGTELGWFAVFNPDADAETARLLITMVEDVKGRGGSGYVINQTQPLIDQLF